MDNLKQKTIDALRWSERYTKTDMIYLAKGSFWLTIGQILSSASAFAVSVAFANLLPKDIFGIYRYVISISSIFAITTLSGLNTALTKSIAEGFEGLVKKGLLVRIKWGFWGSLASVITATYYYLNHNLTLSIAFIIVAIFVPFVDSFNIYNSVLHGKKEFRLYSRYNSLNQIFSALVLIITVYFTNNIWLTLIAFFASHLILNIVFTYRTFNKFVLNDRVDFDTLYYGKNLTLISILNIAVTNLDKILVFQFLGAVELAIYTFATAPIEQLKGFFKNINFLAWPKLVGENSQEIKTALFSKMKGLAVLTVLVSIIYIILAPYFFRLFFPPYEEAIIFSQIIAISLVATVLLSFPYAFLEAQGETRKLYWFNITSNIVNLGLIIPMVYFWGLWGAIIARIIIRYILLVIASVLVKRIN